MRTRSVPPPMHPPARPFAKWLLPTVLALGAAAVANDIAARAAERRNPPRGRFLDIGGVKLHLLDEGSGPPVLLLHGNGAMAEDFVVSGVFQRLSAAHRVIVPDRPGFGHTRRPRGRLWSAHAQAELIARALRQLGDERPVVVGHSWGVMVALGLALNHPDQVAALVLVGGYYHPTFRLDVPLASLSAVPVLGTVLRHTLLPPLAWLLRGRISKLIFDPAPVTRRFARMFPLEMSSRPSQLRATAQDTAMMIPGTAALAGRYGELAMPVAIVGGTGDRIVDFDTQSRWLHARIPHSRLHALADDGHMPHHTEPAMLTDIITQAVRNVNAGYATKPHPILGEGARAS
jgi:pimeloyl-ACP methyl ester carboxylesterase